MRIMDKFIFLSTEKKGMCKNSGVGFRCLIFQSYFGENRGSDVLPNPNKRDPEAMVRENFPGIDS
jgi:hypothetical protein